MTRPAALPLWPLFWSLRLDRLNWETWLKSVWATPIPLLMPLFSLPEAVALGMWLAESAEPPKPPKLCPWCWPDFLAELVSRGCG